MKGRPTMSFMELARERYSVRKYDEKPVPRELLDQVLEAAQIAPTGKNLQPWRIHVLESAEALAKLDALTHIRFGAPLALVFTYNVDEDWKNPYEEGIHAGVEDASIAATQAMFEATELGLGTVWCNLFPNSELEKSLGLPENERIVLVMPLGYPAEDSHPSSRHEATKPLAELVDYL